ncbi:hypothetical protein ACMXYX_18050 (plasmid) [Neptuniibacter sp. QD72_48]|uniref:hypothetical protein n=1 Tax=Neptuniibacter sp. QD72_48 TaxID=3398214 RepID=UPI0039F5C5BC
MLNTKTFLVLALAGGVSTTVSANEEKVIPVIEKVPVEKTYLDAFTVQEQNINFVEIPEIAKGTQAYTDFKEKVRMNYREQNRILANLSTEMSNARFMMADGIIGEHLIWSSKTFNDHGEQLDGCLKAAWMNDPEAKTALQMLTDSVVHIQLAHDFLTAKEHYVMNINPVNIQYRSKVRMEAQKFKLSAYEMWGKALNTCFTKQDIQLSEGACYITGDGALMHISTDVAVDNQKICKEITHEG